MHIKVLTSIFLVIFSAGCATPRKGQDTQIQQFQSRINYLEAELQRKNREINDLENELERTEDELEKIQDIRLSLHKQKVEEKDSSISQVSIRQIQTALKNAGFYRGPIDGKTGTQTKEAIKAFQRANNLKPDGVVGKQTWDKLKKYL